VSDSTHKPILTKKGRQFLDEILSEVEVIPHYCYVTAQRVALTSDRAQGIRIRYHEGTFGRLHDGIRRAHAWNTINGEIIDLTMKGNSPVVVPQDCYYLYESKFSLTRKEVVKRLLARQSIFDWFGDAQAYGHTKDLGVSR